MFILKRDGRSVEFDQQKIYNAIEKASKACGENLEPMDVEYITHKVVSQLSNPCTVEQVQDVVENTLIKYDFEKTAKAYILYRAQRAKLREADSELMEIFNELTYSAAKESDMKRENANIDGDTSMGTMLKYGSESAKYYIDKYILPPHIAKAHKDGDIHIHDKDFYLLTETCVTSDMALQLRVFGEERSITAEELEQLFPDISEPDVIAYPEGLEIKSYGQYVKVRNVVSHNSDDKKVLQITTESGFLKVTSEHRVTISDEKSLIDIRADKLKVGMKMVRPLYDELVSEPIVNIEEVPYEEKVYDLETEDHHFDANGFVVHNCCQIDPLKLYKGGFSTGHGYIREPQSIQSYASLACIAIQANQNEMHGGQLATLRSNA